MEESFEEMKLRYLREMEQLRNQGTEVSNTFLPEVKKEKSVKPEKSAEPDIKKEAAAVLPETTNSGAVTVPQKNEEDTGTGYLIVWTVTAEGAMPVPNADVVLTRMINGQNTLQGFARTDISGRSRVFELPAPPSGQSQTPEDQTPFAQYDLMVRADGFARAEYKDLPVFDGIQSVQQAVLVPDSEGEVVVQEREPFWDEPKIEDAYGKEGKAD